MNAFVSNKNAKTYTVPYDVQPSIAFKFESKDDYVYIDTWFELLGKPVNAWLALDSTKHAFDRIGAVVDGPILMPQTSDDEKAHRIAINKYAVPVMLQHLSNDALKQFISRHMHINVLIEQRSESLHVRTTDGWISVTQICKHLKLDVDDFVKCEQLRNLVGMFGAVIASEPISGDEKKSIVWIHPVGLLPLLLWVDMPSTLELMASYFMTNTSFLPNVDAMSLLLAKNMKLRAQAKAKETDLKPVPELESTESKSNT